MTLIIRTQWGTTSNEIIFDRGLTICAFNAHKRFASITMYLTYFGLMKNLIYVGIVKHQINDIHRMSENIYLSEKLHDRNPDTN